MKTDLSMNLARVGVLALAAAISACSGAANSMPAAQSASASVPSASVSVKPAGTYSCAYSSDEHFNSKYDIPAGSWLLFTSVFRVPPGQAAPFRFDVSNSYITFTANSATYKIQAPGVRISLHQQSASHLNWAKGSQHGIWWLMVPYGTMEKNGADFMDQVAWQVPQPGLHGSDFQGNNTVTWHASLSSGKYASEQIQWQWGAAVYSQLDNFPADYNNLGAKPVDDPNYSNGNTDPAGTPELDKQYLTDGGTNQGAQNDYIGGAEQNHVANVSPCGKV